MNKKQLKQIKDDLEVDQVNISVVQNDVIVKDIYKNNANIKKGSIPMLCATCSKPKYMEYKIVDINGNIEYIRFTGRQHGIFKENVKSVKINEIY